MRKKNNKQSKSCKNTEIQRQLRDEFVEKRANAFQSKEIELNEFVKEFEKLTMSYYNSLLHLNAQLDVSKNFSFKDKEVKDFRKNLFLQIKILTKNPIFMEKNKIFHQALSLTPKECEIVNLISIGLYSYTQIYNNILCIAKRTFDDHLQRIVQKLYNHIQEEKINFPSFANIYPNYPQKENNDGTYTYAKPFEVLKHYLKQI